MLRNKIFMFIVIAILMLFGCISYSMGRNFKMEKEIDLVSKFNLADVDKISIETLEFIKDRPHIRLEVTEEEMLASILKDLSHIKEKTAIDTWCHYQLGFYKGEIKLLELGFHDNPEFCFLRYRSEKEGISEDYLPNEELCSLLHSLIKKQK